MPPEEATAIPRSEIKSVVWEDPLKAVLTGPPDPHCPREVSPRQKKTSQSRPGKTALLTSPTRLVRARSSAMALKAPRLTLLCEPTTAPSLSVCAFISQRSRVDVEGNLLVVGLVVCSASPVPASLQACLK